MNRKKKSMKRKISSLTRNRYWYFLENDEKKKIKLNCEVFVYLFFFLLRSLN